MICTSISPMNKDLLLSSYQFDLPPELIAQRPAKPRHASRVLVYDENTDQVHHTTFEHISEFLPEESSLILNQSKVFPCRLLGEKETGAKVEAFILSIEKHDGTNGYPCLIKSSKKKKIGDHYLFNEGITGTVEGTNDDGTFVLSFNKDIEQVVHVGGKVPIPPYIRDGLSDELDLLDYQTTYAKEMGSVAAPTAGLHFTDTVFESLNKKNIKRNFVTLHVGMGTFAPVKSEDITEHRMHKEKFFVEKDSWDNIITAPKRIAVGTTSLRVLESLWQERELVVPSHMYDTDIFLHPGVTVNSIDGIITNFHLPGSTLIMLVSSLIGREKTLQLYNLAIQERYRFFSYGDAMLILRKDRS